MIKTIIVCVDYYDILALTLPHNKNVLDSILVVSAPQDFKTLDVCEKNGIECYQTDAFYRKGAAFNKGLAIEEAFDVVGRDNWILILDADIIVPREFATCQDMLDPTFIHGSRRRVLSKFASDSPEISNHALWVDSCPAIAENGPYGYFQLFHGSDPVLQRRPWYPIDWGYAAGCDDEFMGLWSKKNIMWLPFYVLHLGDSCQNWCGRVTPFVGGKVPALAAKRLDVLNKFNSGKLHRKVKK